jgi:hypothetical protein
MSTSSAPDTWGQPGHLSNAQNESLRVFLAKASYADLISAKFQVESVESVSLRFLRARNFAVPKALALLSECVNKKRELSAAKWASLTPDECAHCDVEALKTWYPHAQFGFDRFNRPILFEHSGKVDGNAIRQMTSMDHLISYHWWTMDNSLNKMFDLAAQRGQVKISTCVILDLSGMNSHHLTAKVLDHVKALVALDNVCYPELLGKMLVVNAPWLAGTSPVMSAQHLCSAIDFTAWMLPAQ